MIKAIKSPLTLPFCLYTLVFFAIQLLGVPFIRLFEKAICNQYYHAMGGGLATSLSDVDESRCKVPIVQDQLTTIVNWKIFFNAVPGIVLSHAYGLISSAHMIVGLLTAVFLWICRKVKAVRVPYSYCHWALAHADMDPHYLFVFGKWLMKAELIVARLLRQRLPSAAGLGILSLFVHWRWSTNLLLDDIYLVADSFEHSSRYTSVFEGHTNTNIDKRTTNLYLLAAGPNINRFTSPPIAAALMTQNIYTAFWVSLSIQGACLILVIIMKEPKQDIYQQ